MLSQVRDVPVRDAVELISRVFAIFARVFRRVCG
jgi:hypothetical protein